MQQPLSNRVYWFRYFRKGATREFVPTGWAGAVALFVLTVVFICALIALIDPVFAASRGILGARMTGLALLALSVGFGLYIAKYRIDRG